MISVLSCKRCLKAFRAYLGYIELGGLTDTNFNIHYDLFPSYDVCDQISLVIVSILLCLSADLRKGSLYPRFLGIIGEY